MTLLNGRNGIYLLLAALVVGALLAIGLVTWSESQNRGSSIVSADALTPSGDSDVAYEGPSGIHVSGTGSASGAPDIAVISLGVEALEDTAAVARTNAASAIQDVMTVLTDAGVAEADIQTRYFSISPRYQQVQVERCEESDDDSDGDGEESLEITGEKSCYKIWESRLEGYSVSNQLAVKIRNLDNAGTVIDEVTEAAGDLVRINGISFNVEDPQPLQDQARANAVADMKRKAEMLADLSSVKLGRLVYLNEGSYYAAPQPLYARTESAAFADSAPATLISGGELEYSINVQGVFLIDGVAEPEETPEPDATPTPEATESN